MNLQETISSLSTDRNLNQPSLLWGPPGIGKSQAVRQAFPSLPVLDLRLSTLDPVDLRGLPTIDNHIVKWARPEFIAPDGEGILFLDELNTASPSVMNAGLQLVLDRRIGPHTLGPGWHIVAAGNRATDGAQVSPISAPLLSRFNIYNVEPDATTWVKWALTQDIHPHITGFISFTPDLVFSPQKDEYDNFPNPRSWERLSHLLHIDPLPTFDQVAARVGKGAAAQVRAWIEESSQLPDLNALLAGEAKYTEHPSKITLSYALTMACANLIARGDTRLEQATNLILTTVSPEIAVLYLTRLSTCPIPLYNAVLRTKSAQTWALKHASLIRKYA